MTLVDGFPHDLVYDICDYLENSKEYSITDDVLETFAKRLVEHGQEVKHSKFVWLNAGKLFEAIKDIDGEIPDRAAVNICALLHHEVTKLVPDTLRGA